MIRLTTLGGLKAVQDGGELDWLPGQRLRTAVFVYLAVERRASRESLLATFWPESEDGSARHALRQTLYQLRKALGGEGIEARAAELRIARDIRTDVGAFERALARGDAELAARIYRGPFLEGVHLVDLKAWESWVDGRRARYARAFRKACRELVDAKHAAGDLAAAVESAQRWAARDPWDDEAQHRLIETLAAAGERADALRHYDAYARLLEQDGLRPMEATERLIAELRSALTPHAHNGAQQTSQRTAAPPVSDGPRPAAHLSPIAVAVLPFSVRGGGSLAYLGEGMVNLLGAAFDGAGSLRPVDARATFAAVASEGGGPGDVEAGARVATRLGAGAFVLGDLVQAGEQLHLEGAVYQVGGAQAPRARAVVSGPQESVFELVDRLAARLLGWLGDPSADRLLRTAATATASLPAFKAYLQGEASMRAGLFERAAEAYLEAIQQDPGFALAHYRLALAKEWAPLPGEEESARTAARHAERLTPRDRSLLEAFRTWRSGDARAAERAYRSILARYPDDVDAWFQLGEIQFHQGPLLGHAIAESEDAWRKVQFYEPQNLFAVPHLARIAAIDGRTSDLDALLARFDPEELRTDRRLGEIVLLRSLANGDRGGALELAREISQWEPYAVWRIAVFIVAFASDPAAVVPVVRQLVEPNQNPMVRADLRWFASLLALARGRLKESQQALDLAASEELRVGAELRRSAFALVTEWYAATLPLPHRSSALRGALDRAHDLAGSVPSGRAFESELLVGGPIRAEPVRLYTVGVLSLRLGEMEAGERASEQLTRIAASSEANGLVRDLGRGLQAQLAARRGDHESALHLLQALELGESQGDVAVTPFATRANERFLRGEVLVALGQQEEALRWFGSLGYGSVTEIPLRAPAHLEQARIHERLGQRGEAAKHYQRAIELWSDADAEFQDLVEEARARLGQLRAERGAR